MNTPLIEIAFFAVTVAALGAQAIVMLRKALYNQMFVLTAKIFDSQQAQGQVMSAMFSLQAQAMNKIAAALVDGDFYAGNAHTVSSRALIDTMNTVLQSNVESSNAEVAAYATLAEAVQKSLGTHQDLHALVETNMRDLRGRSHTGGAKDTCAVCKKETVSWFINGRGQSICPDCHPEGYADARRRGSAHQG